MPTQPMAILTPAIEETPPNAIPIHVQHTLLESGDPVDRSLNDSPREHLTRTMASTMHAASLFDNLYLNSRALEPLEGQVPNRNPEG